MEFSEARDDSPVEHDEDRYILWFSRRGDDIDYAYSSTLRGAVSNAYYLMYDTDWPVSTVYGAEDTVNHVMIRSDNPEWLAVEQELAEAERARWAEIRNTPAPAPVAVIELLAPVGPDGSMEWMYYETMYEFDRVKPELQALAERFGANRVRAKS